MAGAALWLAVSIALLVALAVLVGTTRWVGGAGLSATIEDRIAYRRKLRRRRSATTTPTWLRASTVIGVMVAVAIVAAGPAAAGSHFEAPFATGRALNTPHLKHSGCAYDSATTRADVAGDLSLSVRGASATQSVAGAACSFSAVTVVVMADGTRRAIAEVEVGDDVLAEDPETGERGPRRVAHVWEHEDTVVDLEIDSDLATTTEDHPFWNATDGEWQEAEDLEAGDLVRTADGGFLDVGGLRARTALATTAFNLTVDGIDTYFVGVGEDDVLVHNTCGPSMHFRYGGVAIGAAVGAGSAWAGGAAAGLSPLSRTLTSRVFGGAVAGGAEGGAGDALSQFLTTGRIDLGSVARSATVGAATGGAAGGLSRPRTTTTTPTTRTGGAGSGASTSSLPATRSAAGARACSFAGATLVLMADGSRKPIEDVEAGDKVLATDPETGETVAREVTHLWVHDDTVIDLIVDGDVITTTEDHPFWNETEQEWQRADQLDEGDLVRSAHGELLGVQGLDWSSARAATAYNLTVDDIHTYYVAAGDDSVLVHNTCPLNGVADDALSAADDAVPSGSTFVGCVDSPPAAIPAGATGPTATRSPGMQFTGGSGGPGLGPRVTSVRVMDATSHHGRRVGYGNATGQTVNPNTGRTIGRDDPWAHIPW